MLYRKLFKTQASLIFIIALIAFGAMVTNANAQVKKNSKYVVIGYVGGYRGLIDTAMVRF